MDDGLRSFTGVGSTLVLGYDLAVDSSVGACCLERRVLGRGRPDTLVPHIGSDFVQVCTWREDPPLTPACFFPLVDWTRAHLWQFLCGCHSVPQCGPDPAFLDFWLLHFVTKVALTFSCHRVCHGPAPLDERDHSLGCMRLYSTLHRFSGSRS